MRLRPLGSTGIDVSEIGLGAWQLGNTRDWQGPDAQTSIELVRGAIELGVTFFDTAPNYAEGRSERLLGEALEGVTREQIVLCTKFGHRPGGAASDFSADSLLQSVENSLRTLRTDYLDVVLAHNPPAELLDGSSPQYEALERLKTDGKIRAYGVSLDWGWELARVRETTRSQACEVLFNAFHQDPLEEMERARAQGIGLIVKVPLDSGWLSGRYGRDARFDDVRSRWGPEVLERRHRLLERFQAILPEGISTVHGALAFVLAQPSVSTVIPGSRSLEQLADSISATEAEVPAESIEAIRALWREELAEAPLGW
jgi:aryl-alcohol dehydrogenase-like predicted oxidoreductase